MDVGKASGWRIWLAEGGPDAKIANTLCLFHAPTGAAGAGVACGDATAAQTRGIGFTGPSADGKGTVLVQVVPDNITKAVLEGPSGAREVPIVGHAVITPTRDVTALILHSAAGSDVTIPVGTAG